MKKDRLQHLFADKDAKRKQIRDALNGEPNVAHRVVLEKEARKRLNQDFIESPIKNRAENVTNKELILEFQDFSKKEKLFIKEKIELYQVEDAIKFYEALGVKPHWALIMVAQSYEDLRKNPIRRDKDNTRMSNNKRNTRRNTDNAESNKFSKQDRDDKAGKYAAELYYKAWLYEKSGDIYTEMRCRVESAEAFEKSEKLEKAAEAYNKAGRGLGGWYIYHKKEWEIYEKLNMPHKAYEAYRKYSNHATEGADPIKTKLSELHEQIIEKYKSEGNIVWLASRYEWNGEKQLAAEMYVQSENWERAVDVYDELGQKEKAVDVMNKFLPINKRWLKTAKSYEDLGEYDKALEVYKKIDSLDNVLRFYLTQDKVAEANKFFNNYKWARNADEVTARYEMHKKTTPSVAMKYLKQVRENRLGELWKAQRLLNSGDLKGALKIYNKLEDRDSAWRQINDLANSMKYDNDKYGQDPNTLKMSNLKSLATSMFAKVDDFTSMAEIEEEIWGLLKTQSLEELKIAKSCKEESELEKKHMTSYKTFDDTANSWYRKALEHYKKILNWTKVWIMYNNIGEPKNEYLTLLNHNIKTARWDTMKNRREKHKNDIPKNDIPTELKETDANE